MGAVDDDAQQLHQLVGCETRRQGARTHHPERMVELVATASAAGAGDGRVPAWVMRIASNRMGHEGKANFACHG